MTTRSGGPVRALSDMEFDQQGTMSTSRATGPSAGRAVQFVHHSTRMRKLEPEYMRGQSRLGLAMPSKLGADLFEVA